MTEHESLIIQEYDAKYDNQVIELFSAGIRELAPRTMGQILALFNNKTGYLLLSIIVLLNSIFITFFNIRPSRALFVTVVASVLFLQFLRTMLRKEMESYVAKSCSSDLKDIQKYYMDHENRRMWIALLNGKVVGTVAVEQTEKKETHVELRRMSVSSSVRRMGIANKLLGQLEKWVKEKGSFEVIELGTSSLQSPAIELYKKNGFKVVGIESFFILIPIYGLFMSKSIK